MQWRPRVGSLGERILDFLKGRPEGATDTDLERQFLVNHTHVNTTCHNLEVRGLIVRRKVQGQIIRNYLVSGDHGPSGPLPAPVEESKINESAADFVPASWLDLRDVLRDLAIHRPIFHSEADF